MMALLSCSKGLLWHFEYVTTSLYCLYCLELQLYELNYLNNLNRVKKVWMNERKEQYLTGMNFKRPSQLVWYEKKSMYCHSLDMLKTERIYFNLVSLASVSSCSISAWTAWLAQVASLTSENQYCCIVCLAHLQVYKWGSMFLPKNK